MTELLSEVQIEGPATTTTSNPSKKQRALQGFLFALRDALLALPKGVGLCVRFWCIYYVCVREKRGGCC